MANSSSYYLQGQLIAHIFRTASFTKPTVLAVALFTTLQNAAGTAGVEVSTSSTGYARQTVDPLDANWAAIVSNDGTTSNVAAINFGTATGNWGTVVGWGLYDATSGGNLLMCDTLSASKTINTGDSFQIPANDLTVQFS